MKIKWNPNVIFEGFCPRCYSSFIKEKPNINLFSKYWCKACLTLFFVNPKTNIITSAYNATKEEWNELAEIEILMAINEKLSKYR